MASMRIARLAIASALMVSRSELCRCAGWGSGGTVAGTPDCPYPVGGTGEGGRCMPDSPSRVISRWALDAVSAPHITASCPL
jgi:hypothetical protein